MAGVLISTPQGPSGFTSTTLINSSKTGKMCSSLPDLSVPNPPCTRSQFNASAFRVQVYRPMGGTNQMVTMTQDTWFHLAVTVKCPPPCTTSVYLDGLRERRGVGGFTNPHNPGVGTLILGTGSANDIATSLTIDNLAFFNEYFNDDQVFHYYLYTL